MKKFLTKLYMTIVNLNQWFNYGRNWLLIPFTLFQLASYIMVALIFFGITQNLALIVVFTTVTLLSCLISGFIFFKTKAEMIDKIMLQWRSPLTELAEIAFEWSSLMLADKLGIPVPEEMKEWGIKKWSDFSVVYEYALEKGKHAKALDICKTFFAKRKMRKYDT